MGSPEGYRVYEGKTFEIEFYYTQQGKMHAYDYYREMSEDAKRRFLVVIGHFADAPFGTLFPKSLFNIEDREEAIYAFKPSIHRFFSFFTKGRKVILLNAYQKHSQQMGKSDLLVLQSAIKMKNDYENRIRKGTYYG